MRKAIFPGSFDPFTNGHHDIVTRGLELFDHITIGIGQNSVKHETFALADRLHAIQELYRHEPRVTVKAYEGLTVDFARQEGATVILRGVRSVADFEYEQAIAETNRQLSGIETVLLYTLPEFAHISSTIVRDLYRHGKDISPYTPLRGPWLHGVMTLVLCLVTLFTPAAAQQTNRIQKHLYTYSDVLRQLDMNYVDTLNYEDLMKTSINSMLRKVDPYTVYIPKEDNDNLKMMTTGKYGGIGAIIMQRDSVVVISEPYLNMPAQQAGLLSGDTILYVDTMFCLHKTTKQVSDQLRGEPGTGLTLRLRRAGVDSVLVRTLKRQEIHLPAVNYYTALDNPNDGKKDGYILFSEFTDGSAQAFMEAVEEMVTRDSIQGLVIDLRGNGGGIIDEAILLVSLFVDKGTEVVSTKGKTASSCRSYPTRITPRYKDLPLVVLVDGNSASAAEIVSGSLQDLHRATLIGQRTFGKGLVQSVRPIVYDGYLKVTTAHYYLPSGRCIQAIDYAARQRGEQLKRDTAGGILPDIVMEDSDKVDISYSLYIQNMLFDYANRFYAQHEHVAAPQTFELSDGDIDEFIAYLDSRHFTYETETAKYLKQVIDVADHEDLDSVTLAQLKELVPRLQPSYRDAIYRNKNSIRRALGTEIMQRYYYQQGRIAYMIRYDEELKRAQKEMPNIRSTHK